MRGGLHKVLGPLFPSTFLRMGPYDDEDADESSVVSVEVGTSADVPVRSTDPGSVTRGAGSASCSGAELATGSESDDNGAAGTGLLTGACAIGACVS